MLFNPELDKSQRGYNKNLTNLKVRPFFFKLFLEFQNIPGNNNNNKKNTCAAETGNFSFFWVYL